jgi:hypothetical protein
VIKKKKITEKYSSFEDEQMIEINQTTTTEANQSQVLKTE